MDKVGIIGYGNMGRAIAERIKDKYAVAVFDQDKLKTSALKDILLAQDPVELVKQSDVIILAIKPQDFDALLNQIKPFAPDKLVITIAAGISTRYIKNYLGIKTRVVRVMPNMPAQVGQGMTVLFKDKSATEADFNLSWQFAYDIFSNLGAVFTVDKEEMINAGTAISGSGPAFFCQFVKDRKNAAKLRDEFIEEFIASAVNLGFDQQEARVLSETTVDGTIGIMVERNLSCQDIIKMVASKGGTTEAGLAVLNAGGSLKEATEQAFKRAGELEKRS
jgi:pyrroline-5-carboxylate reductase